ncbi:hypothetical protein, partial [Zobellella aerophila]|uniref:hypothetical protein n=1 Tax=Zobellella aerophila TaxID=870480 RepID=UPI0031EB0244
FNSSSAEANFISFCFNPCDRERLAPCQWMRIIGSRDFCARAFCKEKTVRSLLNQSTFFTAVHYRFYLG